LIHAILDGDLLLHRAASACQREYRFDDGVPCISADFHRATAKLAEDIHDLAGKVFADKIKVALSDPTGRYWRHQVLPSYKAHRSPKAKPVLFKQLREWVESNYDCLWIRGLEGDDVCGILSTHPRKLRGTRIVVATDKDMLQIPGLLYRPHRAKEGVQEITVEEADRFHLLQTLTGDPTDGFYGIPGVGEKKGQKILNQAAAEAIGWVPPGPPSWLIRVAYWSAVREAYKKAGQTETDALVQARVARILRAGEFHQRIGVRLWTPEKAA
jgi:DNA polymerase-1